MKASIVFTIFILVILTGCTKSETQYRDQEDKQTSINNRASDTINTLPEVSDTLRLGSDSADVKTDNE